MALVQRPATGSAPSAATITGRRKRTLLCAGLAILALSAGAYVAVVARHPLSMMVTGFDLRVYRGAGLEVRHDPAGLYDWQQAPGARFTYTPFAALLFVLPTVIAWPILLWLMLGVSLLAFVATVWMTFGQLGWHGRRRLGVASALIGVALWTEPVQRTLHLGQVELLLMALIVWDLCQPGRRWWQGAGIGLAAGIKLVPLIFIPYLLLTRRPRQAAVAAGAFVVTSAIGWAALPASSAAWWSGDFVSASRTGFVGFQANQSALGLLTRMLSGSRIVTPLWLGLAAVVAVAGLIGAALLHLSGRTAHGWVTCALTGVLVSPISWDHHWVWIVPLSAVLADTALRARGGVRLAWWATLGLVLLAFGGYPSFWRSGAAFTPWGLIWYPPGTLVSSQPGSHPEYAWQGLQLVAGNLYVFAGAGLLAVMLGMAGRAWRPSDALLGLLPLRRHRLAAPK